MEGQTMTTFHVATTAEFTRALGQAKGGDTIEMAGGVYEKISMISSRGAYDFSSKVTIKAADASRPPVINDMTISGAGNIEFKGVKFDWNPAKSANGPFYIQNSKKIVLNDVEVEGHLVGKYGDGVGLRVRDCDDFTVMNSDIRLLKNGINLTNVKGAKILDNNFREISTDGMQIGGLENALISGNDFRDFRSNPNDKHKDAIQVISGSGIKMTRGLTITDNVIVNPEQSHAIFMGNKLASNGDRSAYYRDIRVENNYLNTAHKIGVVVEHGYNVVIRNNTITQNFDMYKDGKMVNVPLIAVSTSSLHVTITGNKAPAVPDAANKTWVVSGNTVGTKKLLMWESPIAPATPSEIAGAGPAADVVEPDLSPSAPAPSQPGPSTPDPAPSDPGSGGAGAGGAGGGNGIAEEFRFNAKLATAGAGVAVSGFSFGDGDVLVFKGFEKGSFAGKAGGNVVAVFDGGGSVKLDTALDVQELVARSDAVSARVSGDTVVLTIEQARGTAEIRLLGFAEEFAAANHPELF